jgi:hypothetical protein
MGIIYKYSSREVAQKFTRVGRGVCSAMRVLSSRGSSGGIWEVVSPGESACAAKEVNQLEMVHE